MFFHAPKIQMVAYYKYWKSSKGKNKQYIVLAFLQNKIRNWNERKATHWKSSHSGVRG